MLALLGAAAVVVGVLALGGPNSKHARRQHADGAAGGAALTLRGVGAYDPVGGDGEHDADAPNATDGNPTTYW